MAIKDGARRLPVGAEVIPGVGVHFRVWAPFRKKVEVAIQPAPAAGQGSSRVFELKPEGDGYFSGASSTAVEGEWYGYRLDSGPDIFPDPASRFQPHGPHGLSQIIDPSKFPWTDRAWRGADLRGQVIYEMHIGTFTAQGTWTAAASLLPQVAEVGMTLIEIMPVADFSGRFGWGYDTADFFAPTHLYGSPDDFRTFVDRAHGLGLGVVLDVVYNHQGPDGCYLQQFSPDYFTSRYENDWGQAINFDGDNSGPVREFIVSNAGYWIDEFHLDGLRLDATQNIYDASPDHILAAVTRRVREASGGRATIVIAENEPQHTKLARPVERGGYGIDALWNDDFHHTARVALTGMAEAYYTDYRGTPQEFISAVKRGYLYQGQYYSWQQKRRGTPSFGMDPAQFVFFIQNHDQIANSARGDRLHRLAGPGAYRAMTALMLLAPETPMLFQGQEFGASSPFLYFADHTPELALLVKKGRKKFLRQFKRFATPEMQAYMADPTDPRSFERSKLDFSERERHSEALALHRDLLRLRREDPLFSGLRRVSIDGAVLGPNTFVLRYFGDNDERILTINFGFDVRLDTAPEPLLAPPENMSWKVLWSSDHPRYGGNGTAPLEQNGVWHIPGPAAVALAPKRREDRKP